MTMEQITVFNNYLKIPKKVNFPESKLGEASELCCVRILIELNIIYLGRPPQ